MVPLEEDVERVRVFVLGDTGVGKTALCNGLCGRAGRPKEVGSESWTVGCRIHVRREEVMVGEERKSVLVEFCDVGGSARFEHSRTVFLRQWPYDGVIFVHDLTWRPSRASIRRMWLPELVKCIREIQEGESRGSAGLYSVEDDCQELTSIFRAMRHFDFKEVAVQIKLLWSRILDVASRYGRDLLGDDSQEKSDEMKLAKQVHVPVLMVGMKRDIATPLQRKAAKEDVPPAITYAESSAVTAGTNPVINAFIQRVIQHKKKKFVRSTTNHNIPPTTNSTMSGLNPNANGVFHRHGNAQHTPESLRFSRYPSNYPSPPPNLPPWQS